MAGMENYRRVEQPKPEQAEVADNEVGHCLVNPKQIMHLPDLQILC